MAEKRKLQSEIERGLKKVHEGRTSFKEILEKFELATQASQKEKYETELKREIKKLQRLRDQIKNWMQSGDVKEKGALAEARRQIEYDMEKFKVIEKETKTKAYSKEGLYNPETRKDPQRKEKEEMTEWLRAMIATIEQRTEQCDAELFTLEARRGGGRKRADVAEKERMIHQIQVRQAMYQFNLPKLETVMRLFDNDKIEVGLMRVFSQQFEDFLNTDRPDVYEEDHGAFMYDELMLEDLSGQLCIDQEPEEDEPPKKPRPPPVHRLEPDLPKPQSTTKDPVHLKVTSFSDTTSLDHNPVSISSTVSLPTTSLATAATSTATVVHSRETNDASIKPPPPPGGLSTSAVSVSSNTDNSSGNSYASSRAAVLPSSSVTGGGGGSHASSLVSAVSGASSNTITAASIANVPLQSSSAVPNPASGPQQQQPPPPPPANAAVSSHQCVHLPPQQPPPPPPASSIHTATAPSLPLLASAPHVNTAPIHSVATSNEAPPPHDTASSSFDLYLDPGDAMSPFRNPEFPRDVTHEQVSCLEKALAKHVHMHPSDTEKSRMLIPRINVPVPTHFPQETVLQSAPGLDEQEYYYRLDSDTLFFIFYYFEGSRAQFLAARALKRMSWRFHTGHMCWFQRHEEPKNITENSESGTYIFYDFESMTRKKKENFTFTYKYLEDNDF